MACVVPEHIHTPTMERISLTSSPLISMGFPSLYGTDEPFVTTQSIRVTFKLSRIETYGYLEHGNIDFFVYLTQLLDISGGPGCKISYELLFNTRSVLLGSI